MSRATEDLELVEWRRRVGDLYRIRGDGALARFRRERDGLFAAHPQSPIPAARRATFSGLAYFPPDPAYRVECEAQPWLGDDPDLVIETGGEDGDINYRRSFTVSFELPGGPCRLTVFALRAYGGGLFLPFRDRTSGAETYGGGRYLLDTVKNTDGLALEVNPARGRVVLDFNYAYNPSCAYDVRWACPLAPRENWLEVAVTAGERMGGEEGAGR